MKKISKKELFRIIAEQIEEMKPVEMSNATNAARLSKDSADDQIDSYILKFENESITTPIDKEISESLKKLTLISLLTEQEEDVEVEEEFEEESPGEGATEAEPSEPAGSEDVDVEEPATDIQMLPLDIDAFAKKVARLSMHAVTVLDIPTVVVNRALNFLKENYDQEHVLKMIDILNTDFDFNLAKEKESPVSPPALGAFGAGEGLPEMGGGGGGE